MSFRSRLHPVAAGIFTAVLLAGAIQQSRAASIPPWVLVQASAAVPPHEEKTEAIVLYSEIDLSVLPNGRLKHLERGVVRILRVNGEGRGLVRVDFDTESRVADLRAWSIPKEGKPYEVGLRDSAETALFGVQDGELVSDVRSRVLRIPAAVPGSVIAYQHEVEDRPNQLVDEWLFEDTVPVAEARYTLDLPPGWSYKATWVNHPEVLPGSSQPGRSEWILTGLKPIVVEDNMPPWKGVAGRMVVALIPPKGSNAGFQSWNELGTWYQGLIRNRMDPSPEMKQAVAELTRSASTPLEKMRALASFVQSRIRYVAIELGIGGHQPHPVAQVFAHRYGDCKDKAALLSALLREIGVESNFFIINTVRGSITESSPANLGFNHAILAIRLPAGLEDPSLLAVSDRPGLGRLLFFDPTDPFTPLGALRGDLQANYGLLVGAEGGELIRTPQLPASLNGVERTGQFTLDSSGTLLGDLHEKWVGDKGALQREIKQAASKDTDVIKPVEKIAADSFGTFNVLKASILNDRATDRPFEWSYSVEVPGYAKSAGDLLLVRPRVIGTQAAGFLEKPEPRRNAIVFDGPERDVDVFEIAFPAGYEVDELPHSVDVDRGFAAYHSKCEAVGHALRYTRTFEVRELNIPAARAEELRSLYRIIADDERNSAVLKPAAARH